MFSQAIGIAVVALAALSVEATNYCSTSLCPGGAKHIACNNNGAFSSSCPAGARLVDMTPYIELILNEHNTRRNRIASGAMSGFKQAKRMATMQWSDELASIAATNVKQCAMKHDACRNTDDFKYSGQNLAYFSYSGAESGRTDAALISDHINAWWSEYAHGNQKFINKYSVKKKGGSIGHFTVMAADKNVRVGCAASRYFKGKFNNFLIACNYATTNLIGWPIYASGTAGSGCTTGRNPSYTSLCSIAETYSDLN